MVVVCRYTHSKKNWNYMRIAIETPCWVSLDWSNPALVKPSTAALPNPSRKKKIFSFKSQIGVHGPCRQIFCDAVLLWSNHPTVFWGDRIVAEAKGWTAWQLINTMQWFPAWLLGSDCFWWVRIWRCKWNTYGCLNCKQKYFFLELLWAKWLAFNNKTCN